MQVSALLGHHPMHLGIACCRAAAFYHANCEGLSSVLGAATLVSSFASNRSISIHIDPDDDDDLQLTHIPAMG